MRFLVTGGAGFIGSHLVERLLSDNHEVTVLDDFSTGKRANLEPFALRIRLIEGTITDLAACRSAMEGAQHVLHQAALGSVPRSVLDPVTTHTVNATGTLNLLLAARDAGVRRFVYAGSSSAYGDTQELPKHEEMSPRPRSPYAVAKLAGEQYCSAFFATYGFEAVTLRYFNVFGPRQDPASRYAAVIPKFVAAALRNERPTIFGDGEQTRDFTYIENVVEANLRACIAPSGVAGGVFNIGAGARTSLNELWRQIRTLTGAAVEPQYESTWPGDVRDSLASLERSSAVLGFRPSVSLADGLRPTVDSFRDRIAQDQGRNSNS
jgi:nucleoside-diphosphate-sugar epimerase